MSGVNKVILVGNVGKDPEVRYLEGGIALARFPLATSDSYKNKEGNKVETTEWHNIVVWNKLAEIIEKYVKKGSQIYIEGKIKTRTYGEENNKKYITEIIADQMTMLGKREGSNQGTQITGDTNVSASTSPAMETSLPSSPADDLPF